ncbi:transferase family-domain-containing protein [Coemansia mojavensis]|nr:transferase family-domain-containing protein [Coemansia mojavensis]
MDKILAGEKVFRAYIGILWFFKTKPTTGPDTVVSRIQQGVDLVVDRVPMLGSTLCKDNDKVFAKRSINRVLVQLEMLPYTLEQIASSGFDQNKEFFDSFPGATPAIDGLKVMMVKVMRLQCGALVVSIHCHHIVADAKAVCTIAQCISDCSQAKLPLLWSDRSYLASMLQICRAEKLPNSLFIDPQQHPATNLAIKSQYKRHQFQLTFEALQQLKDMAHQQDGQLCTANTLVMSLIWRAWTRALQKHGSTSPYTHTGSPIDMRSRLQPHDNMEHYIGNCVLPFPIAAPTQFVLESSLVQVAHYIHNLIHKQAKVSALRAFMLDPNSADDVAAVLAKTDSPVISFSNMSRLQWMDIDFGLGRAESVQLCSFDAPLMLFAISDGNGGLLINTVLSTETVAAFNQDREFAMFANFTH